MTTAATIRAAKGEDYVVFDMETDGLLYEGRKLHCIVMKIVNRGSATWEYYFEPTPGMVRIADDTAPMGILRLKNLAKDGYTLVGHNILGFDLPFLHNGGYTMDQFTPFKNTHIQDTYVNTCLLEPTRKPGLAAWGQYFGRHKPPIEDWSTLTDDMIHRCHEDVEINDMLYQRQITKGCKDKEWNRARQLENKVLWIHAHQTLTGMRVDILGASRLLNVMDKRIAELTKELHAKLPMTVEARGTEVKRPFLANGWPSKMTKDWFSECGLKVCSNVIHPVAAVKVPFPKKDVRIGGPFTRITFVPVNLNSHPKVKELLMNLGWKPTEYNFKKDKSGTFVLDEKGQRIPTSPKLTEESYDSLPPGLGQELAELLKLKHRRRFILNENDTTKGLLSFVRPDGRVACDAFTCGTNTGRYRHTGAFVNLPKITTVWGPEIRSLFTVTNDTWLIGIDLDGIEARVLAHYAWFYDGGAYADIVLKGDVHTANAKALGVDRETAKTFLYAISYGAGAGKLATILGCTLPMARKKIKAFWLANKGPADLIKALEAEYASKGHIIGLDGRQLFIRSNHKLLNTLIQNAATVVFKLWMIHCYERNKDLPMKSVQQVLAYHDELGFEVQVTIKEAAEAHGRSLCQLAELAGVDLKLKVPITAEAKVGKRYSEVH